MLKLIIYWMLSLPLSFMAGRLLTDPFNLIMWLDLLFAVGLLLLMTGGALAVANGGFFNAFAHSWETFFSAINKRETIVREAEGRKSRSAARFRRRTFDPAFLIQGGIAYCLLSLMLSFLLVY